MSSPPPAPAPSPSPSTRNSTREAPTHPPHQLLASVLHRHLRINDYATVRQLLSGQPPSDHGGAAIRSIDSTPSTSNRKSSGSTTASRSSLLAANRIGWTALHFAAASHGAARLGETEQVNEEEVVAEDGDVTAVAGIGNNGAAAAAAALDNGGGAAQADQFGFELNANDGDQGANEGNNDTTGTAQDQSEVVPEGGWWRWLLLQIVEASAVSNSSVGLQHQRHRSTLSPFLRRTEAGMAPTDLFFCGHVRPLPWQRPEVHEAATWLRRDIKSVCGENGLISRDNSDRLRIRMRERIQFMMDEERYRQWKEKHPSEDTNTGSVLPPELDSILWDDSMLDTLLNFWHDMELLLLCAYYGTTDLDIIDASCCQWRVVHALAFTGCPPEVAKLAVALYPEQVHERDERNDLPLHIAVQSRSSSSLWEAAEDDAHAVADIESLVEGVDVITGQRRRGTPYTPSAAPVIKALLDSYPHAAACANGDGRLPLNLALVSGRTWRTGIRDILAACPDALFGTRDPSTHLFPFMLAAIDPKQLRGRQDLDHGDEASFEETDEEVRAKKEATAVIGGMWRFMSPETKERVLAKVRKDIDIVRLDTVFEILRAMPDAVRCGIP
mmetsp:Transcript_31805/g.69901  ORF Transcript_31805/g.69901 Transcript_31805/m.69901 type:complete len:612 (-) Transcript_31805:1843-3678(-)